MYQKIFSPDRGVFRGSTTASPTCVFYPTCSEYSKQAILKYGVIKGSFKSTHRILRCHPWQKKHDDPLV